MWLPGIAQRRDDAFLVTDAVKHLYAFKAAWDDGVPVALLKEILDKAPDQAEVFNALDRIRHQN